MRHVKKDEETTTSEPRRKGGERRLSLVAEFRRPHPVDFNDDDKGALGWRDPMGLAMLRELGLDA